MWQSKILIISGLLLAFQYRSLGQIANYVANGGFEEIISCTNANELSNLKSWFNVGNDTSLFAGFFYSVKCYSAIPYTGSGFQYPHSGGAFYRLQNYCTSPCVSWNSRGYPRNRLKGNLKANVVYCVKMHIVLEDASPLGTDGLAFYFGDNSLDTIQQTYSPLTFLNPQVSIPAGTVILDTLNWTVVSGTFTATGNEKFLVIGNFRSDAATTQSVALPGSTEKWSEYFIDDVSCIPIDLPAFAGSDTAIVPGDSAFIGRTPDIEIDESCVWYQYPNLSAPIATVAGLWVKPVNTSTYIVKQQLWCSGVKWDTVVVYMNPVALQEDENGLITKIYPSPAIDLLTVAITNTRTIKTLKTEIIDQMGQVVLSRLSNYSPKIILDIHNLAPGFYTIAIDNDDGGKSRKKFVISR